MSINIVVETVPVVVHLVLAELLPPNNPLPPGALNIPDGIRFQSIESFLNFIKFMVEINILKQAHCQCIMNAESAANANAVNQNSGGSYDVGLWYIFFLFRSKNSTSKCNN